MEHPASWAFSMVFSMGSPAVAILCHFTTGFISRITPTWLAWSGQVKESTKRVPCLQGCRRLAHRMRVCGMLWICEMCAVNIRLLGRIAISILIPTVHIPFGNLTLHGKCSACNDLHIYIYTYLHIYIYISSYIYIYTYIYIYIYIRIYI